MAKRRKIRAAIARAEGAPIDLEGGVMATGTRLSYRRTLRFLDEYAASVPWWRRLLILALNLVRRLLEDAIEELEEAGAGSAGRPGRAR